MTKLKARSRSFILLVIATAACSGTTDDAAPPDAASGRATVARTVVATIRDSANTELGVLTLTDDTTGVRVAGDLRGLSPGVHALHIHGVGQCVPPFESAGGHWNPLEKRHGADNPLGPHAGDLQNVTVGPDGTARVSLTSPAGSLRGTDPLLDLDGAAVVIHASRDDYRTDPTGGAGGRIACGVIEER